jgi:tetratricopeptide (TPR) repeat protein
MLPRLFYFGLVAAFLCRTACAGPDQWVEVSSAHFTVITDSGEKHGRQIADQFERMRWVFQTFYPKANVDPAAPIVVIAAKNQKVFETMEPAAYLAKGRLELGGFYSHTLEKNYILLRLDAEPEHPFATVYHEYTHLQFMGADAWLPLWLNEGLAEFMQDTEIRDKDVLLGGPSADEIPYLRQRDLIPLSVLFKIDASSPYYHEEQRGSVFYSESWALTHFLMEMDHNNRTHRLADYMSLLSQNEDPLIAAQEAFGDLTQLEKALESYVRRGDYKTFLFSSAAAPIDESRYKVRPLTQVEIDALRADVLAYVQRYADARALVDAVLKEEPNNVQAHETMGYLENRAGHKDEARKWYGDAVKLGSKDYLAYYYFASLTMNEPPGDDDKGIEDSLRMAIRLNPRFAPSYDRLALFYAMRHENLDEAHALSLQAIHLDPGEVAFRVNAANVLIDMQRFDDAIATLRAAEKIAKRPEQVKIVQTRIEKVEQYKEAHALAESYNKRNREQPVQAIGAPGVATVVADKPPKHPTAPANGPKHMAAGVFRGAVCSDSSVLEFKLDTAEGKTLSLYSNKISSIDLTTVGLTPDGSMDLCTDFEGRSVEVQYVDSPDKTADGQVIAIKLRK